MRGSMPIGIAAAVLVVASVALPCCTEREREDDERRVPRYQYESASGPEYQSPRGLSGLSGPRLSPPPRTVVTTERPKIVGPCDVESTAKVIARRRNEISYCYEREPNNTRGLAGKIELSFVIARDGLVGTAAIERNGLKTGAVAECVRERVLHWRFAEPPNGRDCIVRHTWHLEPAPRH